MARLCEFHPVEARAGRISVIAGLDPAIHAARPLVRPYGFRQSHFTMDHWVKPGGDEACGASRSGLLDQGTYRRHFAVNR
jgi:hypothetical protein